MQGIKLVYNLILTQLERQPQKNERRPQKKEADDLKKHNLNFLKTAMKKSNKWKPTSKIMT
jgi:hypothetical protein